MVAATHQARLMSEWVIISEASIRITMVRPRSRSATRDAGSGRGVARSATTPGRGSWPAPGRPCGAAVRRSHAGWATVSDPMRSAVQLGLVAQGCQVRHHTAAVGDQYRGIGQRI